MACTFYDLWRNSEGFKYIRVVTGTLRATDAGKERRKDGMVRKKLPIGIENFEEFSSEDFYYVDKMNIPFR